MSDKPKLSKADKTKIDLWTSHDMTFVVKSRGRYPVTIPKYTKCAKPVYTLKMLAYMDRMNRQLNAREGKPVAVMLLDELRYVWRSDVLTQEEYDAAREADRAALVALL